MRPNALVQVAVFHRALRRSGRAHDARIERAQRQRAKAALDRRALHLATRRFGHSPRRHEHDGKDRHFGLLAEAANHAVARAAELAATRIKLADDHQAFFAERFDRKGRRTTRAHARNRVLGDALNVLRIDVAPAQDDQILDAPGAIQLAVGIHETQVAGAHPWTRIAGRQAPIKRLARLVVAPEVAAGHRGTAHPNLAYLFGAQRRARLRLDDAHFGVEDRAATTDRVRRAARAGKRHDAPVFESDRVELAHAHRHAAFGRGDLDRRLGEAKAGAIHFGAKAGLRKGRGKRVQTLFAHRFGRVERHAPRRQVERRAIRRTDFAHRQVVRKVRRRRVRRAPIRNRLEPHERLFDKRFGRHQDAGAAGVDRHRNADDQTHVVKDRQPRNGDRVAVVPPARVDVAARVVQVALADHHALGRVRRARGVLQKGEHVGLQARRGTGRRVRGKDVGGVGRDHDRVGADVGDQRFGRVQARADRQDRGGLRVARDGSEARQEARFAAGGDIRNRRGDDARAQAGQKRDHEIEPARVQQDRALALEAKRFEPFGERRHPLIEFPKGQPRRFRFAIRQKGKRKAVRSLGGDLSKALHQADGGLRGGWRGLHGGFWGLGAGFSGTKIPARRRVHGGQIGLHGPKPLLIKGELPGSGCHRGVRECGKAEP